MSNLIVAIDPGLSGAVAIIKPSGTVAAVFDLPIMAKGKGTGRTKNCINARELYVNLVDIILSITAGTSIETVCYLETVNSMPGQGCTATFSLGDTFGAIRAVIACIGIPLIQVSPQSWKKYYGITKDKEVARALAINKCPNLAKELARKKDADRAEAILIGLYGWDKECVK